MFGDIFFTFTLDMGLFGEGLATAIGNMISLVVMCCHFFKKKNTLRLVRVSWFFQEAEKIVVTGFSSFFVDVAVGIVTRLINHQTMRHAGADALTVYGAMISLSTFVQC